LIIWLTQNIHITQQIFTIMKRIKLIHTYKMQNTFTIDEIRKYILSQDSLGDILYNLSVSKILEANEPEENEDEDDEDDYIINYEL
jgi:hypothetical protein